MEKGLNMYHIKNTLWKKSAHHTCNYICQLSNFFCPLNSPVSKSYKDSFL
jgi:hypothetical protein